MAATPVFLIGDTVVLRDAAVETVGTVVGLMRDDHVMVAWTIGPGYSGKTIMLSVRALRKCRERSSAETRDGG